MIQPELYQFGRTVLAPVRSQPEQEPKQLRVKITRFEELPTEYVHKLEAAILQDLLNGSPDIPGTTRYYE